MPPLSIQQKRDAFLKECGDKQKYIGLHYNTDYENILIIWLTHVHSLQVLLNTIKTKLNEYLDEDESQNQIFINKLSNKDKYLKDIEDNYLTDRVDFLRSQLTGNINTLQAVIASLRSEIEDPVVILPLNGIDGLMNSLASGTQRPKFNLEIIEQYVNGIKQLRTTNIIGEEFDELYSNAEKLITQIDKLLNMKKEFDNLPFDIKLVASFVKNSHNNEHLNYIVKNIPVRNISVIFKVLSQQINIENQRIYSNDELLAAQKNIYAATKDSDRLKWQHAGRILLTGLLFFIATPFSLFFTISWVRNNQHNTLLETRTMDQDTYKEFKKFRSTFSKSDKNEKSVVFNNQGELKANKVIANNVIKIDMLHEQAERFDRWLKLKSSNNQTTMSDKTKLFFQKSKDTSKEAITSCQTQYANRN